MAQFNPDIGPNPGPNMPDQTGASRGIPTDRSFEALFEGVGSLLKKGAEVRDDNIKHEIYTEVQDIFDEENRDSYPIQLQEGIMSAQELVDAHAQGKLPDSYFYHQLDTRLRDLRSRFPGYEEYIDTATQTITGVRPANAFRDALNRELAAGQETAIASENSWNSWTSQEGVMGIIGQIYPDYYQDPEKYRDRRDEIRASVAQYRARQTEFEFNEAWKQDNVAWAEQAAPTGLAYEMQTALRGWRATMGVDAENFQQTMIRLGQDGLSPEEFAGLQQDIMVFEVTTRQRLRNWLLANRNPEGTAESSFWAILGPEAANKLIDETMAPFDEIKAMVSTEDGDFDQLSYFTNVNALIAENDLYRLMSDPAAGPELRLFSALSKINPGAAQVWFSTGGRWASTLDALSPEMLAQAALGETTMDDTYERIAASPQMSEAEKASLINNTLEGVTEAITQDVLTPEQLDNLFSGFYTLNEEGMNLFNMIPTSEYERLFSRVFSPEITEAIIAKGNPEHIEQYYGAAINRFQAVPEFQMAANHVSDASQSPLFNITVNEDGYLQIEDTGSFPNDRPGTYLEAFNRMSETVDSMNNMLFILDPIIEATGRDPNQVVTQLLGDMAVNLGAKPNSDLNRLLDVFGGMVSGSGSMGGTPQTPRDPELEAQMQREASPASFETSEGPVEFDFPDMVEAAPIVQQGNIRNPNYEAAVQEGIDTGDPFQVAQAFLGFDERSRGDAQVLSAFIKQTAGLDIDPSSTAWCAAFINAVLGATGRGGTNSLAAQSFLDYGEEVDINEARMGDLIIFERGEGGSGLGHVGFIKRVFEENGETMVEVLGGNQANAASGERGVTVNTRTMSLDRLLGVRRPTPLGESGGAQVSPASFTQADYNPSEGPPPSPTMPRSMTFDQFYQPFKNLIDQERRRRGLPTLDEEEMTRMIEQFLRDQDRVDPNNPMGNEFFRGRRTEEPGTYYYQGTGRNRVKVQNI